LSSLDALFQFLGAHPEFLPLVVWPVVTAAISWFHKWLGGHYPRAEEFLQHSGLNLAAIVRMMLPKKAQPLLPPESK
jgi:hypothetical protein